MTASAPLVSVDEGVAILRRGGLIAYPTEAVWGLGCDPFDPAAVQRLFEVKQRPQAKGLILIAAKLEQLDDLVDFESLPAERRAEVLASWPGPHTWTVPATARVPERLRGDHATLAVRVTAHPVAAALCARFGGPIVSTSANLTGGPPPRQRAELDARVLAGIDGVVDGATGGLERPTPIREAHSGHPLRL
jgi:L-threonylcarbamoyladenylate synthase